jgi:hypothetical protein
MYIKNTVKGIVIETQQVKPNLFETDIHLKKDEYDDEDATFYGASIVASFRSIKKAIEGHKYIKNYFKTHKFDPLWSYRSHIC